MSSTNLPPLPTPDPVIVVNALFREYLSRRGLKSTLKTLQEEDPEFFKQSEQVFSSRTDLAKHLGILKWVKTSRSSSTSTSGNDKEATKSSFLEVIVENLVAKKQTVSSGNSNSSSVLTTSKSKSFDDADKVLETKSRTSSLSSPNPTTNTTMTISETRTTVVQSKPSSVRADLFKTGLLSTASSIPSNANTATGTTSSLKPKAATARPRPNDIIVTEDIEDIEDTSDHETSPTSITKLSNGFSGIKLSSPASTTQRGTPLSVDEAYDLKTLLFGQDLKGSFGEEWKGKGFVFAKNRDTAYGLTQVKGGPCGLLAAVQAFVLKHLIFGKTELNGIVGQVLRPTIHQSHDALIEAMTEILWQCGKQTKIARVVLPTSSRVHQLGTVLSCRGGRYTCDGYTESLQVFSFDDDDLLRDFLGQQLHFFNTNDPTKHGLIYFLYSAILSRGIETIRNIDVDEPGSRIIGQHSYCTQEMVNLILVGEAISNVHDGSIRLGDEVDAKVLKGISKPSSIGYLSLFEHYDSLKVGENLKCPTYPIFVVCSESHYTVLFGLETSIVQNNRRVASPLSQEKKSFDLFYWDGLANQMDEIRLTIRLGKDGGFSSVSNPKDLTPPLECCIRTKWKNAAVDWNDSEPLL